jgi:hypothetical protein
LSTKFTFPSVIAGLDPAIQRFVPNPNKALDARVKPAHDGWELIARNRPKV